MQPLAAVPSSPARAIFHAERTALCPRVVGCLAHRPIRCAERLPRAGRRQRQLPSAAGRGFSRAAPPRPLLHSTLWVLHTLHARHYGLLIACSFLPLLQVDKPVEEARHVRARHKPQ